MKALSKEMGDEKSMAEVVQKNITIMEGDS